MAHSAGWHNEGVPTDSPTDPETTSPADSDASGSAEDRVELPAVFRLNRVAYFTVPMVAIVCIILAGTSLVWLGWTLAIPVVIAVWIHRLRTVVTDDGLTAVGTFGSAAVAWTDIAGLQFPRWSAVRAVTSDGERVRLPAVGFHDLPRLSAASRGRIPDPFAAADEADS